jgi:hypothetical protein
MRRLLGSHLRRRHAVGLAAVSGLVVLRIVMLPLGPVLFVYLRICPSWYVRPLVPCFLPEPNRRRLFGIFPNQKGRPPPSGMMWYSCTNNPALCWQMGCVY